MRKMNFSSALVFLLLLIIFFFCAYFFYFQKSVVRNNNDQDLQKKDEEIEYEGWNTYVNNQYNFEFKYPPEAKLNDQSINYISVSFMGDKQKASGRTQTELFDGYSFTVADVTSDEYVSLDDFVSQKVKQLKDICVNVGVPQETTINGLRAFSHELRCLGDYDVYYTLKDKVLFEISLLHVGDDEDLPSYTKTVKQILTTLKFYKK